MSQALRFWKDCWIYTKKSERDNITYVIKRLREAKTICLSQLIRERKGKASETSLRNALLYLLAARVVRVQQHNEVRIYKLTENWFINLKKLTTPFNKINYKSKGNIITSGFSKDVSA